MREQIQLDPDNPNQRDLLDPNVMDGLLMYRHNIHATQSPAPQPVS